MATEAQATTHQPYGGSDNASSNIVTEAHSDSASHTTTAATAAAILPEATARCRQRRHMETAIWQQRQLRQQPLSQNRRRRRRQPHSHSGGGDSNSSLATKASATAAAIRPKLRRRRQRQPHRRRRGRRWHHMTRDAAAATAPGIWPWRHRYGHRGGDDRGQYDQRAFDLVGIPYALQHV